MTAIESGRALLMDGAMGTELYAKGTFINKCFEELNLTSPALVVEVHLAYLRAGADIISTNSWGGNRFKLSGHNLHDKVREINHKAAEIARNAIKAAGRDGIFVAGSVGPLGVRIEPWGPTSFDEARHAFAEQIQALVSGGIDLISLETFSDISELQQAVLAAREVAPGIPVIAQIAINPDGKSLMGTPLEWAMKKLDEWEVDVVGLNCSVGPQPMMTALPKIRATTNRPLCVQPNAGMPKLVEGRTFYMSTPEYFAEFTKGFLQSGVNIIGGCCGTTPDHIRAMGNAFRHHAAMALNERTGQKGADSGASRIEFAGTRDENTPHSGVAPVPAVEKSAWARKIAAGQRVCSVELLPPAGVKTGKIMEQSKKLKAAGIDAINIPDGPRASARMSAILTAVMIEKRAGIETVLHYTCRDRNLLGMQSDMLGAHAIGLRNMLLVTGDPPKMGTYPNATGVFDIDAIGLTNMVSRLNRGLDLGGRPIGEPTALSVGVGVNPAHRDFEYEMKRFRYKVEAGAEWCITQPVFESAALFRFLDYIDKHKIRIPVIAGVWPLLSLRNAIFMKNEVPGVVIPDGIIRRMEKPQDPEDAKKTGVEIAREMVEELGSNIQGLQLSAPFGRIDLALAIVSP
ncbi:bifunctional homocysteine S-methyltransferase/methylenetetrahydrofolate reductase [bacterium]|nr:bifunctional homocysteine S-methyltransferase/methylenetetrahydrofolate reductase [bacterium]